MIEKIKNWIKQLLHYPYHLKFFLGIFILYLLNKFLFLDWFTISIGEYSTIKEYIANIPYVYINTRGILYVKLLLKVVYTSSNIIYIFTCNNTNYITVNILAIIFIYCFLENFYVKHFQFKKSSIFRLISYLVTNKKHLLLYLLILIVSLMLIRIPIRILVTSLFTEDNLDNGLCYVLSILLSMPIISYLYNILYKVGFLGKIEIEDFAFFNKDVIDSVNLYRCIIFSTIAWTSKYHLSVYLYIVLFLVCVFLWFIKLISCYYICDQLEKKIGLKSSIPYPLSLIFIASLFSGGGACELEWSEEADSPKDYIKSRYVEQNETVHTVNYKKVMNKSFYKICDPNENKEIKESKVFNIIAHMEKKIKEVSEEFNENFIYNNKGVFSNYILNSVGYYGKVNDDINVLIMYNNPNQILVPSYYYSSRVIQEINDKYGLDMPCNDTGLENLITFTPANFVAHDYISDLVSFQRLHPLFKDPLELKYIPGVIKDHLIQDDSDSNVFLDEDNTNKYFRRLQRIDDIRDYSEYHLRYKNHGISDITRGDSTIIWKSSHISADKGKPFHTIFHCDNPTHFKVIFTSKILSLVKGRETIWTKINSSDDKEDLFINHSHHKGMEFLHCDPSKKLTSYFFANKNNTFKLVNKYGQEIKFSIPVTTFPWSINDNIELRKWLEVISEVEGRFMTNDEIIKLKNDINNLHNLKYNHRQKVETNLVNKFNQNLNKKLRGISTKRKFSEIN